ncbi:MAG: hypothetical protein DHS20C11_31070 [Lysobacteraceae bacterium]|nr:MAG: hypothetical protein DHS20C11_31070 [Xanthomonadaceae bacterium]
MTHAEAIKRRGKFGHDLRGRNDVRCIDAFEAQYGYIFEKHAFSGEGSGAKGHHLSAGAQLNRANSGQFSMLTPDFFFHCILGKL